MMQEFSASFPANFGSGKMSAIFVRKGTFFPIREGVHYTHSLVCLRTKLNMTLQKFIWKWIIWLMYLYTQSYFYCCTIHALFIILAHDWCSTSSAPKLKIWVSKSVDLKPALLKSSPWGELMTSLVDWVNHQNAMVTDLKCAVFNKKYPKTVVHHDKVWHHFPKEKPNWLLNFSNK